jgi:hypothetical protein
MTDHVIDLRDIGDDFVVHYGGRLNQVNAYTFANSLVALADSIRATNTVLNPGQDVEIAIEALGHGSFRAKLRTTKKSLKNLFSLQGAGTGLIVGLLANQIWQAAHPLKPANIIINDDSVVFEYNGSKVILPKAAYSAYEQTCNLKEVKNGVARAFDELNKDESITEFGLTRDLNDGDLAFRIEREQFAVIAGGARAEPAPREEEKRASVQVVRAILERSSRLWEFVWQGNRISAPVLDSKFYDDLYRRRISLATGDILEVTLAIKQRPIVGTDIYENVGYEVRQVHKHTPRPTQDVLDE